MVDLNAPLNVRQHDVLSWIGGGCPPEVMEGHSYKTVAVAFKNQRLVHISNHAGVWSATLTDTGQYYLVHDAYPDGRPGSPVPKEISESPLTQRGGQELLSALKASGGTLVIPDPEPGERAAYRRAIHELLNGDDVPTGLRLRYTGRDRGDLRLTLVGEHEAPRPAPAPDPIPVPATLRGCHPIIKATSEELKGRRSGWVDTRHTKGVAHLQVYAGSIRRSLLLLQAVIAEGERRGYSTQTGPSECQGLALVVRGFPFEIMVKEEAKRVPHVLTAAEQKQKDRGYGWGIPQWDHLPTGHLVLLDGHDGYGIMTLAADRKQWTLDSKLPGIFAKLEQKAAVAEGQRQEKIRAEERRREEWEAAMDGARLQYLEQHQLARLEDQLARWRKARDLREFVDRARTIADLSEEDEAWLVRVEEMIGRIDPLGRSLVPDDPPDPRHLTFSPTCEGTARMDRGPIDSRDNGSVHQLSVRLM